MYSSESRNIKCQYCKIDVLWKNYRKHIMTAHSNKDPNDRRGNIYEV